MLATGPDPGLPLVGLVCCGGAFHVSRFGRLRAVVDLDVGPAELARMIRAVAQGRVVYVGRVGENPARLGAEELRLLGLLALGLTDAGLAAELGYSERTIRNRLGRLCRQLGVRNRTELAAWAGAHGLYRKFAGSGKNLPDFT